MYMLMDRAKPLPESNLSEYMLNGLYQKLEDACRAQAPV